MQLQQWILLGAGLVITFVGVCLMAYGAVAKGSFAGGKTKKAGTTSTTAQIISALAELLKALGDFIGANMAGKIGFFSSSPDLL